MDSDSYYTTYYPTFTSKEKKHLRQFLGQDYFKRNLKDEQVHRILSRLRSSVRQRLKTKEILPYLSKKSVLTDTEIHHLNSSDAQPQEQAIRLVEFFMNKGTYGVATLYLCLMESSEQSGGVPSHYQLAGELKELVQAECGISMSSGLAADSDTHQQQQTLHSRVKKLYQIPLDADSAEAFTANLGLSAADFRTPPTSFQAVCQRWLSQSSAPGDMDQLVEALVSTRGLGRHTSCLCPPASSVPLEVRNFLLSLGERWVELARFLGFSEEEVGAITEAHASSTEQQVVEFLKLWQLPECGQRTLPLMHKLKALAGIVEPRNASKRLADRPGKSAYMNRRLKTDIMGKPHRSLDSYDRPFHSRSGTGTGPSTAVGSSYQRTQSLESSGYHQRSQGSGSTHGYRPGGRGTAHGYQAGGRGTSHGYQTEGRGTSHGYQTEAYGLSNGYQDERRAPPQGKGQDSSSLYEDSEAYQSAEGYQSGGQQGRRLLVMIFPKQTTGYEGDYEDSYESGYEYGYGDGYGSGYGRGYGRGQERGYGSRELSEQDPVITELPDEQPPDVASTPTHDPGSPPDELCPPLEEHMDTGMELDPNLPPPPDSYIDQQGYTVITNGLALPTDSLTFNDPDTQRTDELAGLTETASASVTSEASIPGRMKRTLSPDNMDVGEPKQKKSNELSEETAPTGFTSGRNPSADQLISNERLEETATSGFTSKPNPGADQLMRKKSNDSELPEESASPGFTSGPNPGAARPMRKKTIEPPRQTAAPGYTSGLDPPDADQPIRQKSNETVGDTAIPSFTGTRNHGAERMRETDTLGFTSGPNFPSAPQPKSIELLQETATPGFASTPSPPEAVEPIRKKSNEVLLEDATTSIPRALNVHERDTHTKSTGDDISVARKQPPPHGVALMGNEVSPTETRCSSDDEDPRDTPAKKSLHLPLHSMEDEPENDLSAVTPNSPDESPIVSVPVQASASDSEPPVMVGLQLSQAVDDQGGVMMQPTLVAGSRQHAMYSAQSVSSQPIGVGMYKSIQSANSELVLQPLHSVGNSPVIANAQLLTSAAAMSPSALQGSQASDDQPVKPQTDLMSPPSLHTLPEPELEPLDSFSANTVHSQGSPHHVELTSEPHMPSVVALPSVPSMLPTQLMQSSGSGEPYDSVQPQHQDASGVFSASPGSSHSATPVVQEKQESTSETPPASPSESSVTSHSSPSASPEHMSEPEEDEDTVTAPPERLDDVMETDSVAREPCSEDVVRALEDPQGLEMLTALVDSGASINSPTANGTYPIHLAVNSGSTDKLLFLLNNNCSVGAARPDGKTALHLACIRQDFQMVQILVEKGADAGTQDEQGFTCLHFKEALESLDIVRYLLHKGAPVDKPSKESNMTPLLVCSFAGETTLEAAYLLITKGASVNGSPMAAMKPLIVASAEGHLRMVELLLDNGVDVNVCDQDKCTALLKACQNNHLDVARQLCERRTDANRQRIDVNKPNKDGLTPLMASVANSGQELVSTLISHGANANCSRLTTVDQPDGGSYTVEMTPLADAAARGNLDIVQVLVDGRAEVNAISENAFPPIAFAVMGNRTNIVEYFLKLNDLNTTLAGLSLPFVLAMKSKNRQCAELLAARYGSIERLLEDAVQEGEHELVEHIRIFQQVGGDDSQLTVETPVQPVQPVQPVPQVELVPRQPSLSPPPSAQDEPLNDLLQEPLNQLDDDDDIESDSSSSVPNPNPNKPVTPPQAASPVPVQSGASVFIPSHTQQNDLNQPPLSSHPPPHTPPQPTPPFNPHTQQTFTQTGTSTSPPLIPTPKSFAPISESVPPPATSSQPWQPVPLPLSTTQVTSSQPWQPGPLPLSTTQVTSSQPWQPGPLPLSTTQATSSQPELFPLLATASVHSLDPPVRAVLPRHSHSGGASVSLQEAGEVARAQAGKGNAAVGEEHDPHSLFVARPKSPPPAVPEPTASHTVLPAPDSLNHSVVEVLHEFAQICISAAVRAKGHEWLIDKALISEYSHIFGFFMQYFDSSAEFARDGKLVAEFIGGSPSPLNFLLGEHLVTKSDFEAVLEEIGRPDFMEQLMMALHQFPDSESLPWTASELMDALFNQHFAIGSPFPRPDSTHPPSLFPDHTPNPAPSPLSPPQTSAYTFPDTGGHVLGWGSEDERHSQSKLMGLAQTATSKPETTSSPAISTPPSIPPTTTHSERATGGSAASMSQFHAVADARGTGSGFGGTTPMDHSDVVKTKGATSAAASFVSPLPSLVQATEEEDDSDEYELNDLSALDDPEPSFEPSFEPQLPPQWQSTGASVAATGSTENPLLSEPQSQLQPQMHSKTQSGASLTLDSQQQGYRLGYGTPSTSSTPPFYQQSRPTTTPAGTTPLPEKTEMTATATETSTTVAKPPPASVSRLSTAAKQPQSSSLPLQSKSESSLFPHTGTSVRNTMPPTSSTQPPEFQQNSFSSSSHVSTSPSFTPSPKVSTSFSARHPTPSTVSQKKGKSGTAETQQPPISSFQQQNKPQSSISEPKTHTSSTAANTSQAPKLQHQSLTSTSPETTAAGSTLLPTSSHKPKMSMASTDKRSSHTSETTAPNPGSKSLAKLHQMLSATPTEPMKPKTPIQTAKLTASKPGSATISTPQQTPMTARPSRIPLPVRIQRTKSAQSSRNSSTETLASKKSAGSTSSGNRLRTAPSAHPKHADATTGKRPNPLSKQAKQRKVVLKQPGSTLKQASPGTSKIQPPTSTHHKPFTSTSSPPKSSAIASSTSRATDGGAWEKTTLFNSTDDETDFEEQVHLDRDHKFTRNESGYSTASANGSSASRTVGRQTSSLAHHEVVFPPVPITDGECKLFDVLSPRVQKWKILGRYLGLEDDILDRIDVENRFSNEKCYKMLDTWKRQFRSDATYRKLQDGLGNIMREDILLDIRQFVPRDHDSEVEEPLHHTIDVRSDENPNLHTVWEEFQQQKNNGMKKACVSLEYRSDDPLHTRPLCFIAPSLDDLRVLEDLCRFASRCAQKEICVSVRYLDN